MFERRLKIMLTVMFALATVMFVRAVQLQVVQKSDWDKIADSLMHHPYPTPTSRGQILDRNNKPLAYDAACIDAAVDYRAIVQDADWIKKQAALRLPPRSEKLPAGVTRDQLLKEEIEHVNADIDRMWVTIGTVCKKSPEEIEEIKQEIHGRVQLLQRNAWFYRFSKSNKAATPEVTSSWRSWLAGERSDDADDSQHDAAVDASKVEVGEQTQAHVIVADLTDDQRFALEKVLPRCPGLTLMQSTHRHYDETAAKVAANVLGHLAPVSAKDMQNQPYELSDALHRYFPRDLIGRDGLEALAEYSLRGAKGEEERQLGKRAAEEKTAPVVGKDAITTIDIGLQKDIDDAFDKPFVVTDNEGFKQEFSNLHGAAVVIDVKTGEVLAMVSHPTYDLNEYEAKFPELASNEVDKPLMNRATQLALPPGSTCKTIIGSVAVTRGVLSPTEGIECDGFLHIPDPRNPNKIVKYSHYRCWTARLTTPIVHHSQPLPQVNAFTGQPGFLSLADGIERSCNVYFETVAWRLKMTGVIDALDTFGLGRKTGIGIAEAPGMIPDLKSIKAGALEGKTFMAGIGQGDVAATPLQMANVSATLARGGIWMRPTLLRGEAAAVAHEKHPPTSQAFAQDRRDLHLAPAGLAAIKEGMIKVVRSPSGTGPSDRELPGIMKFFEDHDVAGKTGSAQITAKSLVVNVRDEHGQLVFDDLQTKKLKKQEFAIDHFPWFHGTGENRESLAHAWFMGYAPARDPQIAFCVLVEYGGSGGRVAGPIGRKLLEACETHGYLRVTQPAKSNVATTDARGSQVELLVDR